MRPEGAAQGCSPRVQPEGAAQGCSKRVQPEGAAQGCSPRADLHINVTTSRVPVPKIVYFPQCVFYCISRYCTAVRVIALSAQTCGFLQPH